MTVKEKTDEGVLLIEELDSSPLSAAYTSHCTDRDPTLTQRCQRISYAELTWWKDRYERGTIPS